LKSHVLSESDLIEMWHSFWKGLVICMASIASIRQFLRIFPAPLKRQTSIRKNAKLGHFAFLHLHLPRKARSNWPGRALRLSFRFGVHSNLGSVLVSVPIFVTISVPVALRECPRARFLNFPKPESATYNPTRMALRIPNFSHRTNNRVWSFAPLPLRSLQEIYHSMLRILANVH
jgi:hypothetical protein